MRKKLIFALAVVAMMLNAKIANANEVNDAVYAWVDGESTCYRLSAMPVVTYNDGYAILTINGDEDVLALKLENGAKLITTFGIYYEKPDDPSGIQNIEEQPVKKVGKYIIGGRVIIVKDGMQFDLQGNRINQ